MSERTEGYAQAIVGLATAEDALDTVEDELLTIARAVESDNGLREQLVDIHVPVSQRMRFVESEMLASASPTTRAALAMVIAGERVSDLGAIAQEVARKAARARNRELAEVTVAVPLDEARREALQAALEQATGKQLEMKVFVDERVVGGVRAQIGDTVIDGSLARRIDDIRTRVGN